MKEKVKANDPGIWSTQEDVLVFSTHYVLKFIYCSTTPDLKWNPA